MLGWESYAGIVRSMTDSFDVINVILNLVNLAVAGITIFIVTYIDVTNRRRQIGVQRAIGIAPAALMLAYLLRAFFYALLGTAVAGLMFTHVVVPLEATYPFRFPFGDVYLFVDLRYMSRVVLTLMAVAAVAALIPIRNVLRMKILEAIWS